ncbi:MAG: glycosyltransferase family 4 protein [Ferruginibacter sp.]|nr:glycosyltransferase family 4 protein [Ferruginibacter sp.]
MQVTVIAPYALFPADNGGRRAITLLHEALNKRVNVQILTVQNGEAPNQYPVKVLPVLGKSVWRYIHPRLPSRIYQHMLASNSRQLIIEHPYMGWAGVWLKRSKGIQLVVRSHNIESVRFRSLGKWWWGVLWHYEKWVHRQADINWFITEEDRRWAITHYGLKPAKCHTITYGIERHQAPSLETRQEARRKIQQAHHISPEARILLFVGALNYAPNQQAIKHMMECIIPHLITSKKPFHILICGRHLPKSLKDSLAKLGSNITYTGFVPDILPYYLGADIFMNPVLEGGGIKTKILEALENGLTVVSTKTGAAGVSDILTGDKLYIAEDNNWEEFSNDVLNAKDSINIPVEFYKSFNWSNIASKAADTLKELH